MWSLKKGLARVINGQVGYLNFSARASPGKQNLSEPKVRLSGSRACGAGRACSLCYFLSTNISIDPTSAASPTPADEHENATYTDSIENKVVVQWICLDSRNLQTLL